MAAHPGTSAPPDGGDGEPPDPGPPDAVPEWLAPGWPSRPAVATLRGRFDDLTGGAIGSPAIAVATVVAAVAVGAWLLGACQPSGGATTVALPMAAGVEGGGTTVPAPSSDGGPSTTRTVSGDPAPAAVTSPVASPTTTEVLVHVAGAVVEPGVVALASGHRVDDAVAAAGGARPDADLDRLNLAAPVTDGARIYVPRMGEPAPPVVSPSSPTGVAAGETGAEQTPISLSSASATELEELPGVGPATASAIVEHRQRSGPFQTVDELLEVRGIGESKLEDLRPHVVP